MNKEYKRLVEEIEKSFNYSNADAEKYAKYLVNCCTNEYKVQLEMTITKAE